MLSFIGIETNKSRFYCLNCQIFHLRQYIREEVCCGRYYAIFIEIVLKFLVTDLVSFLIFAILFWMFLNGIVCEVDVHISSSFESKLRWRCANISLRKPISFDYSVKGSDQHVVSNVELSPFVKQRILYVFLNNKSSQWSIAVLLFPF